MVIINLLINVMLATTTAGIWIYLRKKRCYHPLFLIKNICNESVIFFSLRINVVHVQPIQKCKKKMTILAILFTLCIYKGEGLCEERNTRLRPCCSLATFNTHCNSRNRKTSRHGNSGGISQCRLEWRGHHFFRGFALFIAQD